MHPSPRVQPLPVSAISSFDRRRIRESPNQLLTVLLFWIGLLGIPFLAAASAKGWLLAGIAVVIGVAFATLFVYSTVCQRRMFAFAASEASTCASRADAYSAVIAQFPDILRTQLADLAAHLNKAEWALADRLRETFWDEVDLTYRSLQQLAASIHAAVDAANKYVLNLEGREHTFSPLTCSPNVALFEQVVLRYRILLVSAEQDNDLVQLFELRRHGHSWMPTFNTLKEASHQAETELTWLVVNLSIHGTKSRDVRSTASESPSRRRGTGASIQSRTWVFPKELRVGAVMAAIILVLLATIAFISHFASSDESRVTPTIASTNSGPPVSYVGWFEAADGENSGGYQLELWHDRSNGNELIGSVSHVVGGIGDPTGRLEHLNADPATGAFSFRAGMLGEDVSFFGHWRGDVMSGTMQSTRVNKPWSATFRRGDRRLDKDYRQSREVWEQNMEAILRCCGPLAKPGPRTWR